MLCPHPTSLKPRATVPTFSSPSPRAPSRAAGSFFGPIKAGRRPARSHSISKSRCPIADVGSPQKGEGTATEAIA